MNEPDTYEEAVDLEGFILVYQGCGLFQVMCWISDEERKEKRRERNEKYFEETAQASQKSSSSVSRSRSVDNIHGIFDSFVPVMRCDLSKKC